MKANIKRTELNFKNLNLKIGIFLLFLLFSPFISNAYQSELTIRLQNNAVFVLQLNEDQFNGDNYYHLRNLQAGNTFVEVFEVVYNSSAYYQSSPEYILRFSGHIELMAGYRVNVMIDQYNRCVILSSNPLSVTMEGPERPMRSGINRQRSHRTQAYGMSPATYQHLLLSLTENSFDNARLSIARQAVTGNGCTAEQVLGIMEHFSFEKTKLDFAKHAYPFCVNKGSYFIVNNGFTFENSKRELMKYIEISSPQY